MEGLEKQLEELKSGLSDMTVKQIEEKLTEFKGNLDTEWEEVKKQDAEAKEAFEKKNEEFENSIKEINEHINKLDVKMQSRTKGQEKPSFEKSFRETIKENISEIETVRKGKSVKLDIKADMTLANTLTGDQPRDYSFDVAAVPGQLVSFSDLVGSISISGGTYTYPRETGGTGSIATQTEGSDKANVDYDLTMVDVNTDFIAGYAVYSKKMRNNLPFLQSFLPQALRRDYAIAESGVFNTALAAAATSSTEVITGKNKVEMLLGELATLEAANFSGNAIVMTPADWYDILQIEKSVGAGYGLPGVVSFEGGVLRFNGIPVVKANWLAANKYYVGDWSTVKKVVTEGLSLEFSESDEDNFRKNNITARIEAQVGLAIHRPDSIIYGDFTAV